MIAVKEIKAGIQISEDLVTRQDIPQAHKVALTRIPKGKPVIRYGVVLGYAMEDIEKGDWINEFMLELPTPPSVDHMTYGTNIVTDLPKAPRTTFMGYRNPNGGYAGTRNILGISTTVQCVTGVLNVVVKRIREELLSPAERSSKKGLIYAATPASDIVCGPCQLASGITLQVFMTGRGTPYGLAAAPVIKVCSRNEMKEMWQDLIDVNAGPVATGEAEISEIGTEIFNKILAVASGEDQSFAEKYKLHNDLCIFNPTPIT